MKDLGSYSTYDLFEPYMEAVPKDLHDCPWHIVINLDTESTTDALCLKNVSFFGASYIQQLEKVHRDCKGLLKLFPVMMS